MSWLLGAKALPRNPFCPAQRRASFWEFTMQYNLILAAIAGLIAWAAISSLIHMSEGLLWLNLLWAR